jgi:leader peptidase (prepilin peptidase) / N-methyltransferase
MTPARDILAWLSPLERWGIAALALGVGMLGGGLYGWPQALPLAGLAALTAAIARIDGAHFTIPDLLVLPLALLGLIQSALRGEALLPRLLVMVLLGLALLVLRAVLSARKGRTVMGLGDVKLICAAAAWLPADLLPVYIFLSALSGLVEVALRPGPPRPPGPVAFGRHLAPWLMFCVLAEPWLAGALRGIN